MKRSNSERERVMSYTLNITQNGELAHHGIKGMHWGVRRYQNADGSYTSAGRARYGVGNARTNKEKDTSKRLKSEIDKAVKNEKYYENINDEYGSRRHFDSKTFSKETNFKSISKEDIDRIRGYEKKASDSYNKMVDAYQREAREIAKKPEFKKDLEQDIEILAEAYGVDVSNDKDAFNYIRDTCVRDYMDSHTPESLKHEKAVYKEINAYRDDIEKLADKLTAKYGDEKVANIKQSEEFYSPYTYKEIVRHNLSMKTSELWTTEMYDPSPKIDVCNEIASAFTMEDYNKSHKK